MSISSKNFAAIAAVIKAQRANAPDPGHDATQRDRDTIAGYQVAINDVSFAMCNALADKVHSFNRDGFLVACGTFTT